MTPQRIQLSRRKGFRTPSGTVNVTRASRWGNPFRVTEVKAVRGECPRCWEVDGTFCETKEQAAGMAVDLFTRLVQQALVDGDGRLFPSLVPLVGKDLGCFCALDMPCHADALIEISNGEWDL